MPSGRFKDEDSEGLCTDEDRSAGVNLDRKLTSLFLFYEELQEKVTRLLQQQTENRAGRQVRLV